MRHLLAFTVSTPFRRGGLAPRPQNYSIPAVGVDVKQSPEQGIRAAMFTGWITTALAV